MRSPIEDAIKKTAKEYGISITKLALKAGLPRPSLSKFLAGKADIRLSSVEKLVIALNIKVTPPKNIYQDGDKPKKKRKETEEERYTRYAREATEEKQEKEEARAKAAGCNLPPEIDEWLVDKLVDINWRYKETRDKYPDWRYTLGCEQKENWHDLPQEEWFRRNNIEDAFTDAKERATTNK